MSGQFITDVVIVSSKDACPSGYTLLNQTVNGNNADLYNSSLYKRGDRYLCFAKFPGSSTVVTDVNIVKEKDPVPVGYTAITNCKNDADEKVFRKHILCLKTDNTQKAQHCVSDIVLIQPSKGEETPGDFWRVTNDVNGLFLCYCTKPTQVQAVRQPPPYGHRTNMAYKHPNVQQSYPAAGNPYPVSSQQGGYPRMPFPQRPQQTVPTGNHPQVQAANKLCSAIQGVQFQVNPKFELLWKKADPLGNSTRTLSLDDIEKKNTRSKGLNLASSQSVMGCTSWHFEIFSAILKFSEEAEESLVFFSLKTSLYNDWEVQFVMSISSFDYPYCHEVTKYEKLLKIGQGTFGEVFKAQERKGSRRMVALKKVMMDNEKEGFPITALREIKILQLLKHENIVNLIEICRTKASPYNRMKASIFLVLEFCEHDLAGLLSNPSVKFNTGEIKKISQMLMNALYFIHTNKILHRDMKASNVLITKSGVLKLADFGLARAIHISKEQKQRYTNRVVTLWCRPPELLLGERDYGPPIDVWGAGCIIAEMWTRTPIMQGNTEQDQLTLITHLCGSITPEVWPSVAQLELYEKMTLPQGLKRRVKERLKPYVEDANALDLIDKMLILDPSQRLDSDAALNHDLFWTDPMPCDIARTLACHNTSMFEFLAPPRRTGGVPANSRTRGTAQANTGQVNSYQDRVF